MNVYILFWEETKSCTNLRKSRRNTQKSECRIQNSEILNQERYCENLMKTENIFQNVKLFQQED